jgi:hypothetical protein
MVYYNRLREHYGDQLMYIHNWISHGIDEYGSYSEENEGVQPFWNPPELKPEESPPQIMMDHTHNNNPIDVKPESLDVAETKPVTPNPDDIFGFEMVDVPTKEE